MDKMFTKKSKFLSLVLRHKPELIDIKLDVAGWVLITDLIKKSKAYGMNISKSDIDEIVAENDKKRFTISENGMKIRAAQGHSVNIDVGYEAQKPPSTLFHGTSVNTLDDIMKDGIKPMSRNHVHLSVDKETAHKVGSRHGKVILLKIDAYAMHQNGVKFFVSDNGVWLTDFVDRKYIEIIGFKILI